MFFFPILTLFPRILLHCVSGILWKGWLMLEEEVAEGGDMGWDSLRSWMASCVPAVCQRNTERRGERPIISHTHTFSLSFHTPDSCPAKSARQILLKPSLILIYACGLLLHTSTQIETHIHTHTHVFPVLCGEFFSPSFIVFAHTHMQRGPKSSHAMCQCF